MSDFPTHISITEEGPREGFQSEPVGISVADKLRLIHALAETGLKEVVAASFVNPKVLPQMADAEEIAERIEEHQGVTFYGLWLSRSGFQRALNAGLSVRAVIHASASDTFLMRNNRRSPEQALEDQRLLCGAYNEAALPPGPAYLFTAFGCNYEGDISPQKVIHRLDDLFQVAEDSSRSISSIMLCDTVGFANPSLVERLVGDVRERWPDTPIGLHLHDTRGLGMANATAGLRLGVTRFDASVGGLGGCPFAGNKAAAGNIATEELVFLCEEMGIETGVDLDRLLEAGSVAVDVVGHDLPSRLLSAGGLSRFRNP